MSVHFRNCWMDFDICCFELASLDVLMSADSRFKPVGGEIWYPLLNESAGAKKHRIVSREKTAFFQRPKKCHFFGVPKNDVFSASENVIFSDAQPDVVDHPESTV